jgi:CubicO group peptidase (beta-lactamase class C family)
LALAAFYNTLSDNPKPCCPIADSRILLPTVYQLLTHTGGWDRDIAFDPMFRSETVASALGIAGPSECQDIIYYMFGQNLQHDPGTTYAYSNFGYCILGRVIEQVTGLNYEEAVRQVLLDPAGVSRDEMYIGSTQLIDIPEPETEYYCPGCPLVDSVFPSETDQVPNPYGDWYIEAMDAHGAWVASAPQLMQMLSATADPHCNGTIADQNTDACLLWDTSIDSLTEKPSIYAAADSSWYGLGFSIRSAGTDHNWWHLGSLPGTYTIIVRTNAGYGYAWAMLVNVRGFAGNIDSLMWDAVSCVNDNWPKNFQSPCDFPDPPKPAAPTPSPPTPECKVSFRIFQWLLCLWRNWRNRG